MKLLRNQTGVNDNSKVTLEEFLKFILLPDSGDTHWALQSSLCHICIINYDFIVKFEQLVEEVPFLIEQIIKPKFGNLSKLQFEGSLTQQTFGNFNQYLNEIPQWLKSRVEQLYNKDYDYFDYEMLFQ